MDKNLLEDGSIVRDQPNPNDDVFCEDNLVDAPEVDHGPGALDIRKLIAKLEELRVKAEAETEEEHKAKEEEPATIAGNMQEVAGKEDTDVGKTAAVDKMVQEESTSVGEMISWEELTETKVEKADEVKMAQKSNTAADEDKLPQDQKLYSEAFPNELKYFWDEILMGEELKSTVAKADEDKEINADEDRLAQDLKLAAEEFQKELDFFWEDILSGDDETEEDTDEEKTADKEEVAKESTAAGENAHEGEEEADEILEDFASSDYYDSQSDEEDQSLRLIDFIRLLQAANGMREVEIYWDDEFFFN